MENTKKVTVYGTAQSKMTTGKAYQVTEKLAETLIKKGSATKNAQKSTKKEG
jgi:hypothetical protein